MKMRPLFRPTGLWLALCLALSLAPANAQTPGPLLELQVAEALAAGDTSAAIALVTAALATAPEPAIEEDLLFRLAELHLAAGNAAEAGEALARLAGAVVLRLGDRATEAASIWQQSAAAFVSAGDSARAMDAYVAALRIDARNGTPPESNPIYRLTEELIAAEASPRLKVDLQSRRDRLAQLDASVAPRSEDSAGEVRHSIVRIFYATNRARTDSTRPSDIYRADRGELDYGTAEVSIPHDHVPGALEAPSILSFDVVEDPDKHIVLRAITPADKAETFDAMRARLAETGSNEAFVFIHGFNTSFPDAVRRTAQIAYDMDFDGLPILYSWPSQGSVMGYLADGAVVQLSGRRLLSFLEDVVADSGATRIHLIAHSMGNRALTEALELYALRHEGAPPAFDQVLFTAPDLDAGLFAEMVETIRPAVGRMTLYTSKNDWALRVSNQLNGGAPRAGEGVVGAAIPPQVDSIDMSVLGRDMLAHSYFADDTSALTDILSLFWRDTPPERRCGMTESPDGATSAAWSLEPSLCDGNAMLSALRILRGERIGNLSDAIATIETALPDASPEQRQAVEAALRRLFQG